MVCKKCEKKHGAVITADTWKDSARNTTESEGRKLSENKALTSKKARFNLYEKNKFATCRIYALTRFSLLARTVPIKKDICATRGKKGFEYQKLQANVCLDVLMKFLAFYIILFSALNFQGISYMFKLQMDMF